MKLKLSTKNWFITTYKWYLKMCYALPSPLPIGMTEASKWADSILYAYDFPASDESLRFTLAAMVMNLPPSISHRSKRFFAKSVHKAMANQIASAVVQDMKDKQKARELKAVNEPVQDKTV